MPFTAGQKLHGRYTLVEELGRGSYGVTWLATTDQAHQQVVIKMPREDVLKRVDEETQAKIRRYFDREIKILGLCRHPHIVSLENTFEFNDLPCIVLEYISGGDLWELVRQQGVLPEIEALKYIQQIGSALTLMHQKGHLHLDIKPKNIMVRQAESGERQAVLIDFGYTREFISDRMQQYSNAPGTTGFIAPELFWEETPESEKIDVYSLAATLYYLLTKKVPNPAFVRTTQIEARQVNPKISSETNQGIVEGMAFDLEFRAKNISDWLAKLPLSNRPVFRFGKKVFEFDPVDSTQPTLRIPGISRLPEEPNSLPRYSSSTSNQSQPPNKTAPTFQTNLLPQSEFEKSTNNNASQEVSFRPKSLLTTQASESQDPNFWFNQGNELFWKGQYEEAIAAYDQVLQLKPDYYQA